ncbi:MAG: DUF6802 family protein [Rhodococcus sp. (in: high G+C Gram-positive bacteria)]|uniref:DUF6802 family protein n=1 Tax=Rhodococcus sp. TaxID=1831 RepID=UPI003BB51D1E
MESYLIPDGLPESEGFASGTPFDAMSVAALADAAAPTADLDRDGTFDTVTWSTASALVVATDLDGDGDTDRLTAIADDGEFGVWEFHRELDGTSRWERVETGDLGPK